MSKKLKIRTVARSNLAYGKYGFMIFLKFDSKRGHFLSRGSKRKHYYCVSNEKQIQPILEMLETATGRWKLIHGVNRKKDKVYTRIYLETKIDLALLKLCHGNLITRIYEIRADPGAYLKEEAESLELLE